MSYVRLIPVLDVRSGQVVRGVGGRRAEYQLLVPVCEPVTVARTLLARSGARELYVADLDALAGDPPALPLYAELANLGAELWVDAGLRHAADARPLAHVYGLIAGLETLAGPADLAELIATYGGQRVIASLDLRDGRPLAWGDSPLSVVAALVAAGTARLIVLDLARVGGGAGPGTGELCRELHERWPQLELIAGGGVRGRADLQQLEQCGVAAALVSTALHLRELP